LPEKENMLLQVIYFFHVLKRIWDWTSQHVGAQISERKKKRKEDNYHDEEMSHAIAKL